MVSGPGILIILLIFAGLAFGGERAMSRVREAEHQFKQLQEKRKQQVERLRKIAVATLQMKRELRLIQDTAVDLDIEIQRLKEDAQTAANPKNRLFVLDERRLALDQVWVVTVGAPANFPPKQTMVWTGNRRFMVWAEDEGNARQKIERRFSPEDGFSITGVQLKPADETVTRSRKAKPV